MASKSNPSPERLFYVDKTADRSVQRLLQLDAEHNSTESGPGESGKMNSPPFRKNNSFGGICFNCNQAGHRLNECSLPEDREVIRKNRFKHDTQSRERERIRNELERMNFKPGRYSKELLEAIGISRNELPLWIYRMRLFGFPVGYVQHATQLRRKLSFINGEGEDIVEYEKFDESRVPSYPGLNEPITRNHKDHFNAQTRHQASVSVTHYDRTKMINELRREHSERIRRAEKELRYNKADEKAKCKRKTKSSVDSMTLDQLKEHRNNLVKKLKMSDNDSVSENPNRLEESEFIVLDSSGSSEVVSSTTGTPVLFDVTKTTPPLENFSTGIGQLHYTDESALFGRKTLKRIMGVLEKGRKFIRGIANK